MYKISGLPIVASFRCRGALQHNDSLRTLTSVALAALALLMLTAETKAQVATLEGETFQNADLLQSTVKCDPNQGRIDFEIRGVAVGPYPGTFFEIGFLTFDPRSGLITGGQIDFIVSNETKKTVVGIKFPKEGSVQCTVDGKIGITTFSAAVPTLVYSADMLVEMTRDEGRATLDFSGSLDFSTKPPSTKLQFTEVFHSSNFVPSTLGRVTGGGTLAQFDGRSGVTFGFNAQNTDKGMKGAGTIIDHNSGVKVKILDVATFSIVGTHATFTGKADVNGVEEKYRIDVDDLGEPGTGMDTFKVVTDSYGSGGTLSGGNIQVHK